MSPMQVRMSAKKDRQENISRDIDHDYLTIQSNNLTYNELHYTEYYSKESHVNKMISLLIFLIVR